MKPIRKPLLLLIVIMYALAGTAQTRLRVAVAANMQYASADLKTAFEKSGRDKVDIITGSSGKLAQQIMAGAPFDVFVSADTEFPLTLQKEGFTAEAPRTYAQGVLVLWSLRKDLKPAANLQLLLSGQVKSIALANTKTAPYGTAAEALLKKYNLYNKVKSKLVYGESITQTSQFIATQAADIGFTSKAIVLSKEMSGKGTWIELVQKDYPPIDQSAVLLTYGQQNHRIAAKKFYDFLFSAEAKTILKKFGYIVK